MLIHDSSHQTQAANAGHQILLPSAISKYKDKESGLGHKPEHALFKLNFD